MLISFLFIVFSEATRKFKITDVAYICDSHYISIRQHSSRVWEDINEILINRLKTKSSNTLESIWVGFFRLDNQGRTHLTFELRPELHENISHKKILGNVFLVEVIEKTFSR